MSPQDELRILAKNEALQRAANQFRFYAGHHRSKNPPDDEKANVNSEMAQMCEYAKRM